MGTFKDLTGQVFGRLTVLHRAQNPVNGHFIYLCRCACDGKEVEVRRSDLLAGQIKGCGCLRINDLTGHVFSRLTALHVVGRTRAGKAIWRCLCECGKETEVIGSGLASGTTQSCGCLQREVTAARNKIDIRRGQEASNFKHGHATKAGESPTFVTWRGMIDRCIRPSHVRFARYGGANPPVTVCDRWLNSFEAFLEDMGERPEGTTLGRRGDSGNYEKSNCAWQTPKEQGAEQRIKNQLKFLELVEV